MQNPLEVSFRGIDQSTFIENLIDEKFAKIKKLSSDVVKCHVVLEKLSNNHKKGNAYCVRMDLKMAHFPDIMVTQDAKEGDQKLATAVREVFKRSQELVRKQIERRSHKGNHVGPEFRLEEEEEEALEE